MKREKREAPWITLSLEWPIETEKRVGGTGFGEKLIHSIWHVKSS